MRGVKWACFDCECTRECVFSGFLLSGCCVLARLLDAPAGTKGISLFLVPKRSMTEAGEVGEHNGVGVSRIEDKMGCHGSPTCQIEFEEAQGWLIGQENRGLNHMFTL